LLVGPPPEYLQPGASGYPPVEDITISGRELKKVASVKS
jgi:hypothetical protein